MNFTPEFLLHLLVTVGGIISAGFGVYAGIKSDLRMTKEKAKVAHEMASDTNRQFNQHILDHARGEF